MKEYEIFYLIGESKEAEIPRIKEEVEKLLLGESATLLPDETMDKRKLAYPVKKEVRGTYIARRFTVPIEEEATAEELEAREEVLDFVARVSKKLHLSKDILRFLILKADELPALMKIDRTEKAKPTRGSDTGDRKSFSRGGKTESGVSVKEAPKPEEKPVSQEEMDRQLKEVLDI